MSGPYANLSSRSLHEDSEHMSESSGSGSVELTNYPLIPTNTQISSQPILSSSQQQTKCFEFASKSMLVYVALIIIVLLSYSLGDLVGKQDSISQASLSKFGFIQRIAFGSCTSYDLREMKIWSDAIIPSQPDAWIWVGDMVYLDDNDVNCREFTKDVSVGDNVMWQKSCNCTPSWLEMPPFSCRSGDLDYAQERWLNGLSDEYYSKFLTYMCPKAMEVGIFPPPGWDPNLCDKPILGIYDDHDFGVNNMNRRLPNKAKYKEMFLDAIGEARDSVRRNSDRGAWFQYTLNDHLPAEGQIEVFVLDERYERDTLPCDTMRETCERVILPDITGIYYKLKAWCNDFLYDTLSSPKDKATSKGTCCSRDEDIYWGWCQRESSKSKPFYREACDVTYEQFGHRSLVIDSKTGDLRLPDETDAEYSYQNSPFCDVLGRVQRRWLRNALKKSKAAAKLIVSGSVLFSNPGQMPCGKSPNGTEVTCRCSGDDIDCYSVAQKELLHIISQSSGCPIILTGDFHFSDIKALQPGKQLYSKLYNSENNLKPIYQLMASGMSSSTAQNVTCEDYRKDPYGLRTHPECSFVRGSNFGLVDFQYDDKARKLESVQLKILNGNIPDDVLLMTEIDLQTCQILPVTLKRP